MFLLPTAKGILRKLGCNDLQSSHLYSLSKGLVRIVFCLYNTFELTNQNALKELLIAHELFMFQRSKPKDFSPSLGDPCFKLFRYSHSCQPGISGPCFALQYLVSFIVGSICSRLLD